MRPFSYTRAASPAEASAKATQAQKFIAGGTNLLDLMKLQVETPDRLIDINRIGLDKIEETPVGLKIGALVRNADLAAHPRVKKDYEVLSRALLSGASAQLRNKATTAGNLLQRTRCYYFQDISKPCNKREPGSGCAALAGLNRIHAILGVTESCIASHPSDMAVAMRVLDAQIEVLQLGGATRTIPIEELHTLPRETPHIETTLAPGELITAVTLPPPPVGKQVYRKVRDRASYAFALVSVAAIIGKSASRMAFGGIGPKPWRSQEVDDALSGNPDHAAEALLANAQGYGGNDFKIPLTRRVIKSVMAGV